MPRYLSIIQQVAALHATLAGCIAADGFVTGDQNVSVRARSSTFLPRKYGLVSGKNPVSVVSLPLQFYPVFRAAAGTNKMRHDQFVPFVGAGNACLSGSSMVRKNMTRGFGQLLVIEYFMIFDSCNFI